MTTTYCEACSNVESVSRKQHPAKWLCLKFPRLDGHGFVSSTWWSENEPFMRCVGINGGNCPLYVPASQLKDNDNA